MFCHKCGASNREEAAFCKKCGSKLVKEAILEKKADHSSAKVVVSTTAVTEEKKADKIEDKEKPRATFKLPKIKLDIPRWKFVIAGLVVLILLVVALTPEVKAYYGYYKGMKQASKSFATNNYSDAVKKLQTINQHGLYKTYKNGISQTLAKYIAVKGEDDSFQQAKQDEQAGNFDDAKKLLDSINDKGGYPQLGAVTQELNKVNDGITAKVQADAAAKVAAAQQQEKAVAAQVAVETANRKKAESAAEQAAAQAAASQAAAAAAQQEAQAQAEAAQQAQEQAAAAQQAQQAQATKQAAQMRQTAINSLSSIYHTFESVGIADYNDAIDYYNDSDYTLAETYSGEAEASFASVGDSLTQLSNSYTNLDSDISANILTFESAVTYCMKANLSLIDSIAGTSDSTLTNSYSNSCNSYKGQVASFINSQ